MNITFDPQKIMIAEEKKDENGVVTEKEITLEDHYKTCNGCAYCD